MGADIQKPREVWGKADGMSVALAEVWIGVRDDGGAGLGCMLVVQFLPERSCCSGLFRSSDLYLKL